MNVSAQLIGYPRIGPHRELKRTLERAWSGRLEADALATSLRDLRRAHLDEQQSLIGSAVDDFFLYDEVLETAMMLGVIPDALRSEEPFAALTALARGTPEREAWEMTKWFDTNYHYVVPEIGDEPTGFRPLPWREPGGEADVTWAVLGPYSFTQLSKDADSGTGVAAAEALATWIRAQGPGFRLQLDEPCLGLAMDADDAGLRDAVYDRLADLNLEHAPIVTVQFGAASADTLITLGRRGFAVQVPLEAVDRLRETDAWAAQPEHVIAAMNGRSVWPDDFEKVRATLERIEDNGRPVRIVPSTSLMFLPYTIDGEDLPAGFQFAREKARTLAAWEKALAGGEAPSVARPPQADWPEVGALADRAARPERRRAQADLNLPPFPTTSTGSLPQTTEVRQLRVRLDRGEINRSEYDAAMATMITDAVAWQEQLGLDVLVHGEFERTDMVEYFAARLDGYLTTRNGWVLSYGSRCIRPPILAAPPHASGPMTVREWRIAQDATSKPVKGMLTGPVTIVNWSFRPPDVPDDRLFWAVAQPIAIEVGHLTDAGARVIQVDEPAVRERWPLPTEDAAELRAVYARGVRAALNHVFNQPAPVQMHTHMCYGDFGDIVPLWSDAGVDVASIEFSRSKDDSYIRLFYDLFGDDRLQIGPGVFDVHSPHSPGGDVMDDRLAHFRSFMAVEDLWINPDCGLKTRRWEEIEEQLGDMVAAARRLRAEHSSP